MQSAVKEFREMLANAGVELIPKEVEKVYPLYKELKNTIADAYKRIPEFHKILESKTTEQKLEDIKMYEKKYGEKMTLKDYNQLQKVLLAISILEGCVNE